MFDTVPDEVIFKIFDYLGDVYQEIVNVSEVCKRFNRIVAERAVDRRRKVIKSLKILIRAT
jgi:F-box-like